MSTAPKRTRTKKPSDPLEEKNSSEETHKPIVRKKAPIADTKKEVIQRFPIIRIKPFQGELLINDDDLKQMWTHIKKR